MSEHEPHDVDAHEHESWGRADKSDKPDRADRPDRVDRPDKSDKPQGRDRPEKGERVAQAERPDGKGTGPQLDKDKVGKFVEGFNKATGVEVSPTPSPKDKDKPPK